MVIYFHGVGEIWALLFRSTDSKTSAPLTWKGGGGGRVVQWCWANFQYRGVLLIWIRVGQGRACSRYGWGLFGHFFSRLSFLFLSPSLWETAQYRLKYCLKGPLSPKQPTNQPTTWKGLKLCLCWATKSFLTQLFSSHSLHAPAPQTTTATFPVCKTQELSEDDKAHLLGVGLSLQWLC